MREIDIKSDVEQAGSIDDFLKVLTSDTGDQEGSGGFTARVVQDTMLQLFPDEDRVRNLMMVSNVTNFQMNHIIKSLHSAFVLGLHKGYFERDSVYEYRLKIVEDFLRLRVSINRSGRKDIVEILKAILLNELQADSSRIKKLLGKT
jgi:hypothetical protein